MRIGDHEVKHSFHVAPIGMELIVGWDLLEKLGAVLHVLQKKSIT